MFFSFSVLRILFLHNLRLIFSFFHFALFFLLKTWSSHVSWCIIAIIQLTWMSGKAEELWEFQLCIWYLNRTQECSNGVKGVKIDQGHYFSSYVTSKIIVVTYEILLISSHQKWSFSFLLYSPAMLKYWLRKTG